MYVRQLTRDGRRWIYARQIRPETYDMASEALTVAAYDGNWPDWTDLLMAASAVMADDYDRDEAECIAAEAMELLRRQGRANHRDPLEREMWEREPYVSLFVERGNRAMLAGMGVTA